MSKKTKLQMQAIEEHNGDELPEEYSNLAKQTIPLNNILYTSDYCFNWQLIDILVKSNVSRPIVSYVLPYLWIDLEVQFLSLLYHTRFPSVPTNEVEFFFHPFPDSEKEVYQKW